MNQEYFKDESIFQGTKQFNSPEGKFRMMRESDKIYGVYKCVGDAYSFLCRVKSRSKKPTCQDLYELYSKTSSEQEV